MTFLACIEVAHTIVAAVRFTASFGVNPGLFLLAVGCQSQESPSIDQAIARQQHCLNWVRFSHVNLKLGYMSLVSEVGSASAGQRLIEMTGCIEYAAAVVVAMALPAITTKER